jgi:putative ABC transport system permease protein
MSLFASVVHRLIAILRRRRLDRDLDDEIAFHLAMREADGRAHGRSADAAARDARLRFGNVTYLKEETRNMWTFQPFERVVQDIRYALRTLRRSPGFTIVAVFALAVGIGGNTAIFSMLSASREQALPYPDADRLVQLIGNVMRAKVERRGASYPDYQDWHAQSKSFEDMSAFDSQWMTLTGVGESERILTEDVDVSYFGLLGVAPALGRTFRADESVISAPPAVVVLSDGLWRRRFNADPAVLGRSVTLCCAPRPYTVIGIMPPGFKGLSDTAELWLPFTAWASPDVLAARGTRGFSVLARLKRGIGMSAAQAELDTISRRLEQTYPASNEKRAVEVSPLDVELFGSLRPALATLMAAVFFVLLIACANVSNLLLARSEARQREIAVRTALGAGWRRLLAQLVTEGCVLASVGALAGLALAYAATRALLATSPVTFPSFVTPRIDLRVAVFTVAVSLACGIVLGLAPAVHARISRLAEALKDSSRGSDGRGASRVRSALVVVEVSFAVVLLVGAGLMIQSVRNLAALDPGFDTLSLLTLHASIPRAAVAGGPFRPVVESRALLDRIRAVPGVAEVAIGNDLPLDGGGGASFYSAEGQPPVNAQNVPRVYVHRVTPGFFHALRIPFRAGRTFTETEISPTSTAVIVSENIVKRFWPGQDPIGRRVKFGSVDSNNPWMSVVGVVGETKYRALPENPTADPDFFLPFTDRNSLIGLVVRTTVPPGSMAAAVRAAIRAADSSIPVYSVATMEEQTRQQTAQSRFTMWLMGVFAACALMLAVVGIYGVMSYLVTQRTREIGIRLALGAANGDILRLVVGNGTRLIGAGVAIGIVLSIVLARAVSTMLFGVSAADPASGAAVALLAAVAMLACYVPAARATRINPLRALRQD